MTSTKQQKACIEQLWFSEFLVNGCCGLCGNSGYIDTTGIKTPRGKETGGRFACICPTGRIIKEEEGK